jgi:hypothetical protein
MNHTAAMPASHMPTTTRLALFYACVIVSFLFWTYERKRPLRDYRPRALYLYGAVFVIGTVYIWMT